MSRARDLADLGQDKATLAGYVDTGVTSTDLERIDITTEGTSQASKVVTADTSGHVTLAGDLIMPTNKKVKQKGAFMQSSTHQALILGY